MRKMGAVWLMLISFFVLPCSKGEAAWLSEVHYTMGTLLEITIQGENALEARKILRKAFQELRRLEEVFTDYDPDSPLSRLNRRAGLGPEVVEPELYDVIELSLKLSMATEGAFDITVGPLLDLWRLAGENGRWPEPSHISKILLSSGSRGIKLLKGSRVELLDKGMRLDLGGIGKGYAIDRVVEIFKSEGVRRAFVNFGGSSIYALGTASEGKPWVAWVTGPDRKSITGLLELNDMALSASASFGRDLSIGEVRLGHIIDPKTGAPMRQDLAAVAIAKSAAEAEAFSKALLILKSRGALETTAFYKSIAGLVSGPDGDALQSPTLRKMGIFKPLDKFELIQSQLADS